MANEGFNKAVEGAEKLMNKMANDATGTLAEGAEAAGEKLQDGMKWVSEQNKKFKFIE
jgi:hypothetical protein